MLRQTLKFYWVGPQVSNSLRTTHENLGRHAAYFSTPDWFVHICWSNPGLRGTGVLQISTNRKSVIFFKKKLIDRFFFKKKPLVTFLSSCQRGWATRFVSLCSFVVFVPCRAFAVQFAACSSCEIFFRVVWFFPCVFLHVFAGFMKETVVLIFCLFVLWFCPDLLLFFRFWGLGFFCLLFVFAKDYHGVELCVFLALFVIVFEFFFAKFGCYKHAFLHVCSPSLALLAFLFCFVPPRGLSCTGLLGP